MLVDHHEAGHLGAVRLARKPGADVLVAQLGDDVLLAGWEVISAEGARATDRQRACE